ncbi:MAG: sugar ABC transporter permease [Atribacterota bacterium]
MSNVVKKTVKGFLPLFPLVILLLFVFAYPCISAFFFSLHDVSFGQVAGRYVGLGNFRGLFQSTTFWESLGKSFLWAAGNLVIQLVVPLGIALVLNRRIRGISIARSLVMLPWIIPAVTIAICMRWMLLPRIGIVNEILLFFGFLRKPVHFLGSSSTAMPFLILLNSWKFLPFGTLLILAALQTIPESILEAAAVDGARGFQQFRYITFPILGSMIWFVGFLAFAWNFNTFDLIWLTTQGGPGTAMQTLPILMYRTAFRVFRLGEASALSVLIVLFLLVVGLIYLRLFAPGER